MVSVSFLLLLSGVAQPPGPCRPAADSTARADSTSQPASHDPLSAVLPVLWSNDYGGLTLGVRARPACTPPALRGLFLVTGATRGSAAAIGLYGRWNALPGGGGVSAWSVEGRSGAALTIAGRHVELDALWMATTNLGYLDRGLWDDAGSLELGPTFSTTTHNGASVFRARLGARLGLVYRNLWVSALNEHHLHYDGFTRLRGEMSVRHAVSASTTLGARVFAGAYLGPSNPVRQLRIAVAAADPYETFTNPLLRSRGALLVRPGFHYQEPGGGPNLRGFGRDLGGRWAVSVNLELTRAIARSDAGLFREVALEVFGDVGLVDTLAAAANSPGRWYSKLYDGGVGIVTRQQVRDLAWTMRLEAPLLVNRWNLAADYPTNSTSFALRWQVSFEPSF